MAWTQRGLSARAAFAVSFAGCDTVEEVTRLGRKFFASRPNCGLQTLTKSANLAGWPPYDTTTVDAIAAALALAIDDPAEAREASVDVVVALRTQPEDVPGTLTAIVERLLLFIR